MPIIPVGAVVAMLAVAFVVASIYMVVRMAREAGKAAEKRQKNRALIEQRAAASGRSFRHGQGEEIWRQQGKTRTGLAWTLTYEIAFKDHWDTTDGPTTRIPDGIAGQSLQWHCPDLKCEREPFRFCSREVDAKAPEIMIDPEHPLWGRWRLEVNDEALARRAFSPAVCESLAMLPAQAASNTEQDRRTSIVLSGLGLSGKLGVYEPKADLVDRWIEICESITVQSQP